MNVFDRSRTSRKSPSQRLADRQCSYLTATIARVFETDRRSAAAERPVRRSISAAEALDGSQPGPYDRAS